MNTQPSLPFSSPFNWLEGIIECQFNQLPDVLRRAEANGFIAARVDVSATRYRVRFQRKLGIIKKGSVAFTN